MKARWYISTLIIILTLCGAVSQQQSALPNQEIVLQFANDHVSSDETQNAIVIVKQQLLAIGVDNIQVRKQEGGKLKITYYSTTDVASIKKILSNNQTSGIDYTSNNQDEKQAEPPLDSNSNGYNLDVYEIQNGNDALDLGGKFALELKVENDRFLNSNVFMYTDGIDAEERDRIVKTAYKLNRNIAIAIEKISYIIPEVRAGPSSFSIQNALV
ncbi:hypothetical protein A9Q87_10905 [Flavobacteriales bacterium 34_180_T64]|nr:hypothetical protein A9Q87_10905 [Flavobacteriales bacterium 34_180_T64]